MRDKCCYLRFAATMMKGLNEKDAGVQAYAKDLCCILLKRINGVRLFCFSAKPLRNNS